MKIKRLPYLAGSLLLTLTMAINSCSSSQQQQQQEAIDGQQQGQEENFDSQQQQGNEIVNQQNEQSNNFDNQENFGNQENLDNQQQFADNEDMIGNQEGGGNEFAEAEEEGDLEDIVEEMNQTAGVDDAPIEAEPAPQGVDNPAANGGMNGEMAANDGMANPMNGEMAANGGMNADMAANGGNMQASNNLSAGNAAGGEMAAAPMDSAAMATPAGTDGLPEMGAKMSYVVQKNDTLGKIAQKIYGDMSRWRELAAFTGVSNPSLIYPGDLIYYQLDETSVAFARSYENLQRSEVVVSAGDTLAKIATRVLGDAQNWRAIWRQNDSINDPDKLVAGDVLFYISADVLASVAAAPKAKASKKIAHNLNPVQDTVKVNQDDIQTLTLTNDQTTLKPVTPIAANDQLMI